MRNITRTTRLWALPVVIVWWMVVGAMGAAAVSAPTLVSVSTDSSQSIIASWTVPESVYYQELVWSTNGSLRSPWSDPDPSHGVPLDCYFSGAVGCSILDVRSTTATTVSTSGVAPGTYYVQLVTRVVLDSHGYTSRRFSNILTVVVLPPVVVLPSPDPSTTPTVAIVGSVTIAGSSLIINGTPATGSVQLRVGDKITAGTDGDGFSFSDGSKVVLTKGTTFTFTGPNAGILSLGNFWSSLKKRKFQVTSFNAGVSVRGTILTVEVTKTFTRLRTYEGAATFKNVKGKTKRTVTVKKGFESIVRLTQPPTKPRKFKQPTKQFWA